MNLNNKCTNTFITSDPSDLWYLLQEQISAVAEPLRYEIENEESKTKLVVHNLTEADGGLYYCGAVYAISTTMGRVELKVRRRTLPRTFTQLLWLRTILRYFYLTWVFLIYTFTYPIAIHAVYILRFHLKEAYKIQNLVKDLEQQRLLGVIWHFKLLRWFNLNKPNK